MIVDNGARVRLTIHGVFDGKAGMQGGELSFIPNMPGARPEAAKAGLLDGKPVKLTVRKAAEGGVWLARYEVFK